MNHAITVPHARAVAWCPQPDAPAAEANQLFARNLDHMYGQRYARCY
jgi:hypothetical protein